MDIVFGSVLPLLLPVEVLLDGKRNHVYNRRRKWPLYKMLR
jgi:hypothetical protein